MSPARTATTQVFAFLTVAFSVVCIVRLTADAFAVLAVVSLIGLAVSVKAYERNFWAR